MPDWHSTDVHYDRLIALRPGVYLARDTERLSLFRQWLGRQGESFGAPGTAKLEALGRLADRPYPVSELLDLAGPDGGELAAFLAALRSGGWLVTTVRAGGRDLYSLQPVEAGPEPAEVPPRDVVLSRFTVLRREGDEIVVESPLARARMLVHDPAITTIVAGLARPGAAGDVPEPILRDLVWSGLARSGPSESTSDSRLWSPHDLWLHRRSRAGNGGYAGAGFGRTTWAAPYVEPQSPPAAAATVPLARPDLESLRRRDPPLTAVLEDRRSIRTHDDATPITADQFGELLYRCAAVRHRMVGGRTSSSRPYPSGGAAYELELYPVVRLVHGLDEGFYHYDPQEHRLDRVPAPALAIRRLLAASSASALMPARPQLLIIVAARFGRVMSTYEELSYSLVLKHVGVLLQTMYLAATAMGLAGCALGAGDPTAFTAATGHDYTTQSSVGEFILGSRPAEPAEG